MRVLFVHDSCGFQGGLEQTLADSSQGLRERGYACHLAHGPTTGTDDIEGFRAHFDACHPCVELGAGEDAPGFASLFQTLAPDVVYLHKVPELRRLLPQLSRVPTVRMVHDHDLYCPTGLKYYRHSGRICHHPADLRCWLDGGFLRRTRTGFAFTPIAKRLEDMRLSQQLDLHLTPSRYVEQQLLENGFAADRVKVLTHLSRIPQAEPAPPPQEPRVLFVGQLIRGKGVDLLLRALARVSGPFRVSIVGEGAERARLEQLGRSVGLGERVTFHGWTPHGEISPTYAAARFLVVPSRWPEPLGLVGLEAMHHGRAVVGFDVGGISDWLHHERTGLLVPPQDLDGLARACERLLREPELAGTLGRQARDVARAHYAFDAYLDRVEAMLAGLIATSAGPA